MDAAAASGGGGCAAYCSLLCGSRCWFVSEVAAGVDRAPWAARRYYRNRDLTTYAPASHEAAEEQSCPQPPAPSLPALNLAAWRRDSLL